ncbi:cyclin-A2-like isoform X2 [Cylas formicarius]|uniref:cyclin-A2-like isoform X2 n=1 Tax=Cylas formicarius TaxID=197179 RepID=UPI0029583D64|nr:cyclin-A2-like isoform X2 [Cylas formicarius]
MSQFQIHEDVENRVEGKVRKVPGRKQKENTFKTSNVENKVHFRSLTNGAVRPKRKRDELNENLDKKNEMKDPKNQPLEEVEVIEIIEESYSCSSNPTTCEDYRKDIWKHLYKLEIMNPGPKSSYMLKQSNLNWNTRSILVDWLASVVDEYNLCNETFHLSINYIDRFLCHISVVKEKFQLVGAAAMLLAGKMEETYPIVPKEWPYLTGDAFTLRQILKMERLVAKVLQYRMQPPTICTFVEHFCTEHKLDVKTLYLAMYISDLVLLEGDEYLNHLPSKLAAASVALARYILNKETTWPKKFKETTGYTLKQLSPVVERQHRTFKNSPIKKQQAIQSKYKSDKYEKVALLKLKPLALNFLKDE